MRESWQVLCVSLLVAMQAWTAQGMFSKRPLPDRANASPNKRLKLNLEDLYLGGMVSGQRAQTLFEDAAHHDAKFKKLAAAGDQGKQGGNVNRDLRRKLSKSKHWPKTYIALIRVWSPRQKRMIKTKCPFLLPHELLYSLLRFNDVQTLCATDRLAETVLQHVNKVKAALGTSAVVPLGLWGDGVPCNWDRTESLELLALSLPGLAGKGSQFRMPLVGMSKKFMLKQQTWDDIFKVLAYSFEALAAGNFPTKRHDGSNFQHEAWRKNMAGKGIGARGCLAEVRADWQLLQHTFRFPAWNQKLGCCWKCAVTPASLRDFSLGAAWRTQRLSHMDLLDRWHLQGKTVSPVFSIPYLSSDCFAIDWLHAVDLGVGCDWLGNLFLYCLPRLAGANRSEKTKTLWELMQNYYSRNAVDSQFQDMTISMFWSAKKGAKLRSKAAECRGLIPFGLELANQVCTDPNNVMDQSVKGCALHLNEAYNHLASAVFDADTFGHHVRQFLVLWTALEEASPSKKVWNTKPKFHLLAELAVTGNCPSLQWVYRDEDFGGTAAQLSHRRGGKNSVLSTGLNFLCRFLGRNKVPVL